MTQSLYQLEEWQTYRWESADRFYTLDIKQDLFGEWLVCCSWGSILNRRGRYISKSVNSLLEARQAFQAVAIRRKKRGYHMVYPHGKVLEREHYE